jgi:hypothetical protein
MLRIQTNAAILLEAGPRTYEAVQTISKAFNTLVQQLDLDPAGVNTPTQSPAQLNVMAANGIANLQIIDNFPGGTVPQHSRTVTYIVEAATDKNFNAIIHTEDMGVSRNKNIFVGNQTLYFRVISQTAGSPPSKPTLSQQNPVTCGGVAAPTQQTYQGSGTSNKISAQGAGKAAGNRVNTNRVLPVRGPVVS